MGIFVGETGNIFQVDTRHIVCLGSGKSYYLIGSLSSVMVIYIAKLEKMFFGWGIVQMGSQVLGYTFESLLHIVYFSFGTFVSIGAVPTILSSLLIEVLSSGQVITSGKGKVQSLE